MFPVSHTMQSPFSGKRVPVDGVVYPRYSKLADLLNPVSLIFEDGLQFASIVGIGAQVPLDALSSKVLDLLERVQ